MITCEADYIVAVLADDVVTSLGELSHLLYWKWKLGKATFEYMKDDETWQHLACVNYQFEGQIKYRHERGHIEILEGDATVPVYKFGEAYPVLHESRYGSRL
jgi:hypothetical protein